MKSTAKKTVPFPGGRFVQAGTYIIYMYINMYILFTKIYIYIVYAHINIQQRVASKHSHRFFSRIVIFRNGNCATVTKHIGSVGAETHFVCSKGNLQGQNNSDYSRGHCGTNPNNAPSSANHPKLPYTFIL